MRQGAHRNSARSVIYNYAGESLFFSVLSSAAWGFFHEVGYEASTHCRFTCKRMLDHYPGSVLCCYIAGRFALPPQCFLQLVWGAYSAAKE